mgnify:CR=1 FL=1
MLLQKTPVQKMAFKIIQLFSKFSFLTIDSFHGFILSSKKCSFEIHYVDLAQKLRDLEGGNYRIFS